MSWQMADEFLFVKLLMKKSEKDHYCRYWRLTVMYMLNRDWFIMTLASVLIQLQQ